MLGRRKGPLRAAIDRATELYQRGAAADYLAVIIEARKHAAPDGDGLSADEIAALAEGWEIQGYDELHKGRLQAALESLTKAESILIERPEHNELRGRICFQIAQQISANTPQLRPIRDEYIAKARTLLADSAKYRDLFEAIPADSSDDQEPWQVRRARLLGAARTLQEKHRGRFKARWTPAHVMNRIVKLHLQAIYIGIEEGDDKAARESFVDAAFTAVTLYSSHSAPFFAITSVFSHILDRPRLNLSEELSQIAETAMSLAVGSGSEEHLSEAYLLAALRDREIGDTGSCCKNALASVWHSQRHEVDDSPSVMMRGATNHRLEEKAALAVEIALELGEAELVAELIESSRLQALAETAQVLQFNSDGEYDLLGLLAATGTSLQDVHPVSVGGVSRVREAIESRTGPEPLPLEQAISTVGGCEAVYWGSWTALRKYYWVIRAADGTWSAGSLDLGPYADTVFAANSDLHPTSNLSTLTMLEDRDQELLMMRELGRMVIPPTLIDILQAARSPISLVVAGGFVCELPLPALVIPRTMDQRLLEKAVIRIQPPLVLMKAIHSQPSAADIDNPLIARIACLDPSGDLPYSRNYDIPAETLLTTPSKEEWAAKSPPWSRPATRANLTECLRTMEPGEPGIFVYSGHVEQNGLNDGPGTSLVLADGLLSAAELAGLPIPSHVLLSACSSSGASGAGVGEWLGLAGSLLRGGAWQIAATSWPIPDSKFTARFELELVRQMRADGDAATALRRCQLDALTEWRSHAWRRPSETLDAPFPRIWAAFQMIGLITRP